MRYKYTKFTGSDLEGLDLEELLSKLSDLLLSSGFDSPYGDPADEDGGRSVQSLHDAILDAILRGELLPKDTIEQLLGDPADGDSPTQLEELIQQVIERLAQQGYITMPPDLDAEGEARSQAGAGQADIAPLSFEVTDKSLDFLGYRALRDLLGSVGKSSVGRHDTRDQATGVEASGNDQALRVRRHAQPRRQRHDPERGAACRPAGSRGAWRHRRRLRRPRRHAGRVSELLRDRAHARLQPQHDSVRPKTGSPRPSAWRWPSRTSSAGSIRVTPCRSCSSTTRPRKFRCGSSPACAWDRTTRTPGKACDSPGGSSNASARTMRQIIMITDGKPSALTQPDGRIYRNAFGLDPLIVSATFAEVAACRKAGILINTFMLARDYDLVSFVRRVAKICHGKAYFTTPYRLGQYVLMDYMNNKTKTVH